MTEAEQRVEVVPPCNGRNGPARRIEENLNRFNERLNRVQIAPVAALVVYAFNCADHEETDTFHMEYCAKSFRSDIPNSLQATIVAVEHMLATLKAKLQ